MHGDQSLLTMDATMFGKQPKIGESQSLGSNLVHDGMANHGYVTVIYWLLHDQNNSARTDSQNNGCIPTVEIIFVNNEKSGLPATILEQANKVVMFLLQNALKKLKKILPRTNLPPEFSCRYVEADNGLAERLSSAQTWGRKAVFLRERWHTMKCAFKFIEDTKGQGIYNEEDVNKSKNVIMKYFGARSPTEALKYSDLFINYFKTKLFDKVGDGEVRASHIKHMNLSIGTTVFKAPVEVCDFGRKNCQALKVASGPISETVNSAVKSNIGKKERDLVYKIIFYLCTYTSNLSP